MGVRIRHTITRGVGGHAPLGQKNNVGYKNSAFLGKNNRAFPVNLTPLSRNNFVLWVEPLYIIFQKGGGGGLSRPPLHGIFILCYLPLKAFLKIERNPTMANI